MRDAAYHAGKDPSICSQFRVSDFGFRTCSRYRTEAQRVETKLGTRAHREDVANDSANAGGRALKGFNRAWMVVALHLECDRPAIADIDYAGVFFAGFHQNIRPPGRKFLKFFPRILIGAMFAPHDGENAELGEIWFAAEDLFDALEFLRRKSMLRHNFRCHHRIENRRSAGHWHVTLTNSRTRSMTQPEN